MKKSKINKSQIIRDHLKTSKDKSPTAVVKALRSKGVKVSTTLVSVVKHSRRRALRASSQTIRHAKILSQARKFIDDAGGVTEAKALIEVVNKIVS